MIKYWIALLLLGFIYQVEAQKKPDFVYKPQQKENHIVDSIYKARISAPELFGTYIPKDLFDCFKELDKRMDESAKEKFMAFSDAEVDPRTHGTLGRWIDHNWSLRAGSRLSHYFNKMGVPHHDYMVGVIIQSYHRHLHGRDLEIKEQVERFREIWQEKRRKELEAMGAKLPPKLETEGGTE